MFVIESDSELPVILNNLIIEANKSPDYFYLWRGMIGGEEYKIIITTDDFNVTNINVKFRGKCRKIGDFKEGEETWLPD
jgi:thiamine monophosphate kinase